MQKTKDKNRKLEFSILHSSATEAKQRETFALKRDGLKAYERKAFSLLK
jgi:hypothetical protein